MRSTWLIWVSLSPKSPLLLSHTIKPYLVLILGAADPWRRWPLSNFVELAKYLIKNTELQIVLCGTSDETFLAQAFLMELSSSKNRIINLCGTTSILELLSVLASATVVISNDTGAMHLAVAAGRPTVCIAGVGAFGHVVPYPSDIETHGRPVPITVYEKLPCYGCQWQCIYDVSDQDPKPCVSAVRVETVLESVLPLVKDFRSRNP